MITKPPPFATGFGMTSRHIAAALHEAGHAVTIFGVELTDEMFNPDDYPYVIKPVGQTNLEDKLRDFLQTTQPDVIFINFDLVAHHDWVITCRNKLGWTRPIVSHFVLDGVPNDRKYTDVLHRVDGRITPTHTAAAFLRESGIDDVQVASHGVDPFIFRPLDDREQLRDKAGLAGKFVIGVFGRNSERKQQPRVMMALSQLKQAGMADDLLLYLHCQPQDDPRLHGWDLKALSQRCEIDDLTYFPHKDFQQLAGVPYIRNGSTPVTHINGHELEMPRYLSYVERINCCDMIINPAHCGGFELSIIESQACGVPVVVTNDGGIMAEVAGEGAYLMDWHDRHVWKNGAWQHFVSPQTIATAITTLKDDALLRERLIAQGLANAAQYRWDDLRQTAVRLVEAAYKWRRGR